MTSTSEISWLTVTRVSPVAGDGGKVALSARPTLVWIRDPADPSHARATEAAFADASIGIGSRAFRTVAITPSDAAADPLFSQVPKGTALVVVSRDHVVATVLVEPRLTAIDVYSAMLTSAAREYSDDLRTAVDTTRDVRVELARVAAERHMLAGLALDTATRQSRADALDARERAAREKEQRAWPLHLRVA